MKVNRPILDHGSNSKPYIKEGQPQSLPCEEWAWINEQVWQTSIFRYFMKDLKIYLGSAMLPATSDNMECGVMYKCEK
jgi:hypothetical protein